MKFKIEYDKKFKVLQLDGGGLKGIMFLKFLTALEEKLNKKCYEIFDLTIGTSTGGISAALIASGLSASEILKIYKDNADKIFKKRILGFLNPMTWINGARYDRTYLDDMCKKYLSMNMRDLKCQFICTGVNMNDSKSTHFFKSYKEKYQYIPTYYPIMATDSAPTYFGYFFDKQDILKSGNPNGGVWSDGGVGVQNCTLLKSYIECQLQNKLDSYFILSCGCGYTTNNQYISNLLGQIIDYLPIASEQSITEQINECKELNVNFFRVDDIIDKKYTEFDNPNFIDKYLEYGENLVYKFLFKIIE